MIIFKIWKLQFTQLLNAAQLRPCIISTNIERLSRFDLLCSFIRLLVWLRCGTERKLRLLFFIKVRNRTQGSTVAQQTANLNSKSKRKKKKLTIQQGNELFLYDRHFLGRYEEQIFIRWFSRSLIVYFVAEMSGSEADRSKFRIMTLYWYLFKQHQL